MGQAPGAQGLTAAGGRGDGRHTAIPAHSPRQPTSLTALNTAPAPRPTARPAASGLHGPVADTWTCSYTPSLTRPRTAVHLNSQPRHSHGQTSHTALTWMRTAVHTESHTHAATHTPTALHVDTGELHRNTHPHTSCTHAEPHTHTRTHTRSHTAVLLASQPGKTIACSEGTQSPATCARPSTRTRPHPAGHVLTPAWAQPHPRLHTQNQR